MKLKNHKLVNFWKNVYVIDNYFWQVELHPYFQQRKLRDFCKEHGIVVTAFSPLGNPTMPFRKKDDPIIFDEPIIKKIAETHGKTPAQVIFYRSLFLKIPYSSELSHLVKILNILKIAKIQWRIIMFCNF